MSATGAVQTWRDPDSVGIASAQPVLARQLGYVPPLPLNPIPHAIGRLAVRPSGGPARDLFVLTFCL
jgi:hypothetical protein